MSKTGKGLPRSLVNAEFDIPAATTTAIGGLKVRYGSGTTGD